MLCGSHVEPWAEDFALTNTTAGVKLLTKNSGNTEGGGNPSGTAAEQADSEKLSHGALLVTAESPWS